MGTEMRGDHVERDRNAGRRAHRFAIVLVLAALLALCALTVAGCTSEEGLVKTLSTEQDATVRQEAAADLAGRHSVVATQDLVTAAATDATASAGLDSLVSEYAAVLNQTVQTAADAGKEFDEKTTLRLKETVDCLACAGNQGALDSLGGFATTSSGTIPNTTELQLYCVQALGALKTPPAVLWLGQMVGAPGMGTSAAQIGTSALGSLTTIGEPAVDVLVGALGDKDWADEVLVAIGAPAISRLVQDLQSPDTKTQYTALGVLLQMYGKDGTTVASTLVKAEMVPLLVGARAGVGYGDARDTIAETVLQQIGQPAVAALLAVVPSNHWASGLLAKMGSVALPDLVAALGSQPCAESVLAEMGAAAIPKVVEQLDSTDETIRHRAIGVLLRMYQSVVPEVDGSLLTAGMVPRLLADVTSKTSFEEYQGFDHAALADVVLEDIGEPAVGPILASDYDFKWYLLQDMGATAVPALTTTMNGKDREDSLMAAMTLALMAESAPMAVASFTTALESKDLEFIAANYLYYIALGKTGSDEVIAQALLKYGKMQMGLDCLNSGNDVLDAAGQQWGKNHGYIVTHHGSPVVALPWGGVN